MTHAVVLAEMLRGRSGGSSGYAYYLMFHWLWQHLHWWGILIGGAAVTVTAFIGALLGGDDE